MRARREPLVILGAGLSGLGAAIATRAPLYEAESQPGGVCHSYYLDERGRRLDPRADDLGAAFRFEPAGGHWLFGASSASLERLRRYASLRGHVRQAAVFLPDHGGFVPYPIQDNLRFLDASLRRRILSELGHQRIDAAAPPASFKSWLHGHFGPSLCELFFFPFNERYTAGMYADIAPQDLYKCPVDLERVRVGAREPAPDAGYNQSFHYPSGGLDWLVGAMAAKCDLQVDHRVVHIDVDAREIHFDNGVVVAFDRIVSTLPLDLMSRLCGRDRAQSPDPATAVLVVNIGARKGPHCPRQHWVYLPRAKSSFHRLGFYSHVDAGFLPERHRASDEFVSIYAERSFAAGAEPSLAERAEMSKAIVDELLAWDFIAEAVVVDATYTDPAYTWARPSSAWAQQAIGQLAACGIRQIGRYGTWHFQGMVESFEQGLAVAAGLDPPGRSAGHAAAVA